MPSGGTNGARHVAFLAAEPSRWAFAAPWMANAPLIEPPGANQSAAAMDGRIRPLSGNCVGELPFLSLFDSSPPFWTRYFGARGRAGGADLDAPGPEYLSA